MRNVGFGDSLHIGHPNLQDLIGILKNMCLQLYSQSNRKESKESTVINNHRASLYRPILSTYLSHQQPSPHPRFLDSR